MRKMRKTIWLSMAVIFFSLEGIYAQEELSAKFYRNGSPISVHAFQKHMEFPWACKILIRPSVFDKSIKMSCDALEGMETITIYFKSSDQCSASDIFPIGESSVDYKKELQNSSSSDFWFYEAEYQLDAYSSFIYLRMVKDDEVCMIAISSSREMVAKAMEPIWE